MWKYSFCRCCCFQFFCIFFCFDLFIERGRHQSASYQNIGRTIVGEERYIWCQVTNQQQRCNLLFLWHSIRIYRFNLLLLNFLCLHVAHTQHIYLHVHSDPYVRIDLNTIEGDINLDSVLTKTKKKVRSTFVGIVCVYVTRNKKFFFFRRHWTPYGMKNLYLKWRRPNTSWCCRCSMRIVWHATISLEWSKFHWPICQRSMKIVPFHPKVIHCVHEGQLGTFFL